MMQSLLWFLCYMYTDWSTYSITMLFTFLFTLLVDFQYPLSFFSFCLGNGRSDFSWILRSIDHCLSCSVVTWLLIIPAFESSIFEVPFPLIALELIFISTLVPYLLLVHYNDLFRFGLFYALLFMVFWSGTCLFTLFASTQILKCRTVLYLIIRQKGTWNSRITTNSASQCDNDSPGYWIFLTFFHCGTGHSAIDSF